MVDALVQKMAQETFDLFLTSEKQMFSLSAFHHAFKTKVAPKNKVFYHDSRGSYGYFLEATKREVKRLIKKYNRQPQNLTLSTGTIRVPTLLVKPRNEL